METVNNQNPGGGNQNRVETQKPLIESVTFCYFLEREFGMVSPVAQTVKNLPAKRETWIRSLGWEDPLEEGMATHSSILA